MKKSLLLSLFMLVGLVTINAQKDVKKIDAKEIVKDVKEDAAKSGAIMEFEAMDVDYGVIEKNSEPLRVLKFTNTGTEPLVIKNARGSCGCTVPIWPKEPIMPGEESKIEVRYATNRVGKFNKKITITTNEGGEPHVIKVHGKVLKPEDTDSVPASGSGMIKPGGE